MKLSWPSQFIQSVWRSITDLNFFVEILNYPLRNSGYIIIAFYLILGLVFGGIFSVTTLPKIQRGFSNIEQQVRDQLPAGLTLSWNGKALTSSPVIDLTVKAPEELKLKDSPELFLNVDLKDQLTARNSLFTITQHATTFSYLGEKNETSLADTLGSEQFAYDTQKTQEVVNEIFSTAQSAVKALSVLSVFYFSFGLLLGRLIMLIFDAVILQFAFQLMGKPLSYKKVFQICLHLLIPTELVSRFQAVAYPQLDFPIWSITFWLLSILVLWHLRNLHIFRIEMKERKQK